ncbi:hypothetical protein Pyn_37439 [Prunus yedoensis var. nudiflora]|uniref:Uncharacterized protein n=1 Tax=Prunus yedoensis var. nudiflora TaxID=2094558 RepID=A0A314YJ81_PRUYE|nr:hypothetical protein Pyn_37439 [Prunus yedoensis var. nudiflora]
MFWAMAWVSQTLGIWKFSMSHYTDVFAFLYCVSALPIDAAAIAISSMLLPLRSHALALSKYSKSDGHCSLMIEDDDY